MLLIRLSFPISLKQKVKYVNILKNGTILLMGTLVVGQGDKSWKCLRIVIKVRLLTYFMHAFSLKPGVFLGAFSIFKVHNSSRKPSRLGVYHRGLNEAGFPIIFSKLI